MRRILVFTGKSLYFLLALGLILFLVYLFGHSLLKGELKGGDSPFAFHNAFWYQRWWPRIPLWYPIQGGGYSFTLSYPILPSLLTVFLERVTPFDLNQAFRLVYFGLYFWAALGIYLFGAWRLRNQTIGLMAAIFYLILPGIWYWSITVGLFAFVVASSFIPWVFIFFDFWLECFLDQNCSLRKRALALFLASLSLGVAMMSHVLIGVPLVIGLPIYGLMRGRLRGILATLLCLVMWGALFGFWLFPYFYYNYFAGRGGVAPEPVEIMVKEASAQGISGILFGQATPDAPQGLLSIFRLSPVVSVSFLTGLILTFFLRGKVFAIGTVAIIFMFLTGIAAKLPADWVEQLQLPLALNFRSVAVVHTLSPLIASLGIWQIARLISRRKTILNFLLSWLIFISGLVFFERGIIEKGKVDAYDFFKSLGQTRMTISNLGSESDKRAQEFISLMSLDKFTRVAWTMKEGMSLLVFGNYTEASTLSQYMYRSSLFRGLRGYCEEVTFKGKGSPTALSDIARWVGYKYALTKPAVDETPGYLPPDWEIHREAKDIRIYKFQDYQGMATITQRPVFLVIGKEMNAYEQVFKAAVEGVLPYEKAWLVEGGERIDDYSLKELDQFEGLILHGYSYKRVEQAFSLLEKYVENGGRLFINTGWQYTAQDWELEEAPSFFPVTGLRWSAEIPPGSYPLNPEEEKRLGVGRIPLEWEGKSWGVSVAEGLKPWAKPVLEIQGKTIMVEGEYGKGKVFWSGLNLFAYLDYQNFDQELVGLGREIFKPLLVGLPEDGDLPQLGLSRDYPDRLEINLEGPVTSETKLFWREAYSPQWRVTLKENGKVRKTPFYRAGPGFLLMPLPKTDQPTKVILEYKLGWEGWLGKLVTLVATGGFLLLMVFPKRLERIKLNLGKKLKDFWERED